MSTQEADERRLLPVAPVRTFLAEKAQDRVANWRKYHPVINAVDRWISSTSKADSLPEGEPSGDPWLIADPHTKMIVEGKDISKPRLISGGAHRKERVVVEGDAVAQTNKGQCVFPPETE